MPYFQVNGVTEGLEADALTKIIIYNNGESFSGEGQDQDVIVAATKAYVDALNQWIEHQNVELPVFATTVQA